MPGYSIDGGQNAAANISILQTLRGAAKRHRIGYIHIGSASTPDDQAQNIQVNRVTADGIGTSVTPQALDPGEGPAVTTAEENQTTEPTKTAGAVLLSISHNTRSAQHWYAKENRELVAPDTADNGLTLVFVLATGTQLCEATIHFDE